MSRPTLWLVAGAAIGVALAAAGLVTPTTGRVSRLPPGIAARVNGEVIREEDVERAVAALAQDRRSPPGKADRERAFERLIDEELLVQRGLELGLARQDAQARAHLTRAVIATVVREAEAETPDDAALIRFYQEHRDFFVRAGRIRMRQVFFRVPSGADVETARRRAAEARARLEAGEPFEEVRQRFGDRELAPVPDAPLPPEKLLDYVGPTVLRRLLRMEPGSPSEPVRSGTGLHVLELLERTAAEAPPFEEIREAVLVEYRRRAGERALREYLDELRERAAIETARGGP